jgi:hypothetical protein
MSEYDGPLRLQWQASFDAGELIQQCRARQKNHEEHAKYWDKECRRLNDEVEKTQYVETQKVTGGEQRVLRYDQGLLVKVQNAEQRRDLHRNKAAEYQRWIILLEKKKGGGTLPLRYDDVTFFFQPLTEVPK